MIGGSEEVAAAQFADDAFLTQVQMIRTTPSSAGGTASPGGGGAWDRKYADFGA